MARLHEATDTSEGDSASPADPNRHIRSYLVDYLSFPHSPGSAVLLTGAWGSGKTFLVRKVIEKHAPMDSTVLSVSLYGLTGRREIVEALLLARYPVLANAPAIRNAVRFNHTLADVPTVGPPEAVAYVFDDLERCAMPITEAMGFINLLVERDGRKVVVLVNEENLTSRPDGVDYAPAKEKVVGRSFTVKPDFDSAFESFVSQVDSEPTASFLRRMRADVRSMFHQSGIENLRILQQTMWDFERVYGQLREEHQRNVEAMAVLLRLFFALSFELRGDRLKAEDLIGRIGNAYAGLFDKSAPPNRLRAAGSRYPGVALHDTILPDEILYEILIDGFVDAQALVAAVDQSSWFRRDEEPSWRTVWHAFERPDEETEVAAVKLIEEFNRRAFVRPGEMLHVFGQMLKLSDFGITQWTRTETVTECRKYIDDLRAEGRLAPPASPTVDHTRFGSYAGLGFDQRNGPEFNALWGYLREQSRLAELDRHPQMAEELLRLLKEDPPSFAERIGPSRSVEQGLAQTPVLAATNAAAVADVLVQLPSLQFNEVLQALSGRYELGAFRRTLGPELPWAKRLEADLLRRAENFQGFKRERIRQMVAWTLSARLAEAQGEEEH
ncbi:MAG TPA: P-loop NTPase fold protein [Allosphingosinicella sp.]|nr:P-loop NTPase fold protein [Allosphingosinicella sp.]